MNSTFLIADLAGFTALTEAHGDGDAAEIAEEFCTAVRGLLPAYDGEMVKSMGDAVLVRLPEAGAAVHLAARLLGDYGVRHRALGIRVGMHTGTAVQRGDDWFGAAVNVATRVGDLAGPGEALMTADTEAAARDRLVEGQLSARGRVKLKNVREPVEIFELVPEGRGGELPIDPVCRMAVDPYESEHRLDHDGATFHFCSPACRDAFEADPAGYL